MGRTQSDHCRVFKHFFLKFYKPLNKVFQTKSFDTLETVNVVTFTSIVLGSQQESQRQISQKHNIKPKPSPWLDTNKVCRKIYFVIF